MHLDKNLDQKFSFDVQGGNDWVKWFYGKTYKVLSKIAAKTTCFNFNKIVISTDRSKHFLVIKLATVSFNKRKITRLLKSFVWHKFQQNCANCLVKSQWHLYINNHRLIRWFLVFYRKFRYINVLDFLPSDRYHRTKSTSSVSFKKPLSIWWMAVEHTPYVCSIVYNSMPIPQL